MSAVSHQAAPAPTAFADRLGIATSLACAVHCVLSAVLVGSTGFVAFLDSEGLELLFLGAALSIAALALVAGYRAHGHARPLAWFAGAVPFLLASHVLPWDGLGRHAGEWGEVTLSVVGASFLVTAHVLNLRLGRSNHDCAADHCH